MSFRIVTLAASFVTLVACQLLPSAMQSGVSTTNPLDGQPVKWSQKSDGVPIDGEKACTTWPIEDELTATASAKEICVKGGFNKVRGAELGDPGTDLLRVESDGVNGDPTTLGTIASGRARKTGQCVDQGATKSVWQLPYDGCVANKDDTGAAALTKRSTYLEVGAARWKFSPTPSEATTTAAASTPAK